MLDSNSGPPLTNTPPLLDATMRVLLRTPFVQSALGKYLALLTYTGRRSGKRYTIPVSYKRTGQSVLLLTKRARNWWRNFDDEPQVQLRLAGRTLSGTAVARVARETDLDEVVAYLSERPQDAKAFGATMLPDGSVDPASVLPLLQFNVLIRVQLD
jgi:deazaflavin-dependent oxidoreductase (nitroreductase family)